MITLLNIWREPWSDIIWYRRLFIIGRGIGGGLAYICNISPLFLRPIGRSNNSKETDRTATDSKYTDTGAGPIWPALRAVMKETPRKPHHLRATAGKTKFKEIQSSPRIIGPMATGPGV